MQAESEARIQRSLDSLETAARAESDRARASSEVLLKAEAQLAAKFKAVVGDLRRSWEVPGLTLTDQWACVYERVPP